jgi:ferritin-like metal-binding protein YciE
LLNIHSNKRIVTMKKLASLEDLFMEELKDIYHAEKQLTKALPKLAKAATSPELKSAFQEHLQQTMGHVERLESIFELMGAKAKGKTCKAMEGLIEEGKEVMEENAEPPVMDAALIAAAQKVEHYEIGTYGTLATFARMLGQSEVASLLKETLNEEKTTDAKLTRIAERNINIKAVRAGGRGRSGSGARSAGSSSGNGRGDGRGSTTSGMESDEMMQTSGTAEYGSNDLS